MSQKTFSAFTVNRIPTLHHAMSDALWGLSGRSMWQSKRRLSRGLILNSTRVITFLPLTWPVKGSNKMLKVFCSCGINYTQTMPAGAVRFLYISNKDCYCWLKTNITRYTCSCLYETKLFQRKVKLKYLQEFLIFPLHWNWLYQTLECYLFSLYWLTHNKTNFFKCLQMTDPTICRDICLKKKFFQTRRASILTKLVENQLLRILSTISHWFVCVFFHMFFYILECILNIYFLTAIRKERANVELNLLKILSARLICIRAVNRP